MSGKAIPDLFTPRECAERLRLHPESFRRILSRGEGPAVTTFGCKRMIRADDLVSWIERSRRRRPVMAAE